jgi:hypothetical protein
VNDIASDKPLAALRCFARALGWPRLRMHESAIEFDHKPGKPTVVTWHESRPNRGLRDAPFLQINERSLGERQVYSAAVYAIRFKICTGWHVFRLTSDLQFDLREAERLDGWLNRRWFECPLARREFRLNHPECANYTWSRIRTFGPPHLDAKNQ